MEKRLEILKNQLAQAHDSYKLCYSQCSNIKKWYISLWTGIGLGVISKKFEFNTVHGILFFLLFSFGFCVLEAIFAMPMTQIRNYQRHISEEIQKETNNYITLLVDYLNPENSEIGLKEKLKTKCRRLKKTMLSDHLSGSFFYGFMFIMSLILLIIL